jgi:sporulation protein YpjB
MLHKTKRLIWPASVIIMLVTLGLMLGMDGFTEEQQGDRLNQEERQWQHAKELAEQAFHLVEEKRYSEARQTVIALSEQLLQLKLGDYVNYVEQADMVLETLSQAKGVLTQARLDEREAYRKVLRMRLTIDAVLRKEEGMWIQFFPEISKTITELRQSIEQNKRDQFYRQFNQLYNHYEFIRPAIVVSHTPQLTNKLDSLMTYFDQNSPRLWQEREYTLQLLNQLDQTFGIAFYKESDPLRDSIIWLTMGVAFVIASVLTYVGWKKYKGQYTEQAVLWQRQRSRID